MRVNDVPFDVLTPGRRVKDLTGTLGTIINIDPNDDCYVWVKWDTDEYSYGGWYGNTCNCELLPETVEESTYLHALNALLEVRSRNGYRYL